MIGTAIVARTLALTLAVLSIGAALNACGQNAQITSVEVTEYGLYTSDITDKTPNATGPSRGAVTNIRLAETTRTIPARVGVQFGFRYRIVGTPNGASATITRAMIFPQGGLRKPGVAEPILGAKDNLSRTIGETHFASFKLEEAWEIVPGDWTFELWAGDRKLATQSFKIGGP